MRRVYCHDQPLKRRDARGGGGGGRNCVWCQDYLGGYKKEKLIDKRYIYVYIYLLCWKGDKEEDFEQYESLMHEDEKRRGFNDQCSTGGSEQGCQGEVPQHLADFCVFIHLETSAEGKKAGRMLSSPACPHHHVADWHWLPIVLQ